ncbi:hypothetical protein GRS48_04585 [Halorubrum sp. JWXQ-INN 858]|uniref:hypothetical protein n=1 Tax=Halorubrum sp. JWXQ-INN 858 TaxID=2690782 RepID=UPI00135B4B61|nr:hypothetical protein [Halorubrum sp. JWXQ-INN 858]MWV64103.1 hypothetical protein [Halorubrum sp. JWXQ-INN 858]
MVETPRRRVLEVAATGTALSLAGCSALDGDEDAPTDGGEDAPASGDGEGDDDTSGTTPSGEAAATVAVDIDDRMAEREADIQERLQDEEIDQEEAQAEFQEAQLEALEGATAAVEEHVVDIDGLAVADSSVQAGALLVDGDAAAVLETLELDDVAALVSAAEFEGLQ